jgi:hypothetical protein
MEEGAPQAHKGQILLVIVFFWIIFWVARSSWRGVIRLRCHSRHLRARWLCNLGGGSQRALKLCLLELAERGCDTTQGRSRREETSSCLLGGCVMGTPDECIARPLLQDCKRYHHIVLSPFRVSEKSQIDLANYIGATERLTAF